MSVRWCINRHAYTDNPLLVDTLPDGDLRFRADVKFMPDSGSGTVGKPNGPSPGSTAQTSALAFSFEGQGGLEVEGSGTAVAHLH